jgi:AraC family transcriptional regulator
MALQQQAPRWAPHETESHRPSMRDQGAYGQRLADAFHLETAPSFVTRNLQRTEIAVTQIICRSQNNELTAPVAREDAFLVKLQIDDWPKRALWMDGKMVRASPLKAGAVSIFDLRSTWVGQRLCAFHSISFYLPRRALDALADIEGAPRIDQFAHDPGLGVEDLTIAALGRSLLPAFERPDEANHLFIDHITIAAAAHVLRTYGVGRKAAKQQHAGLADWQERRVKELLMAHLDGDVAISELAMECGLSISEFNRAFERSVGSPPYKWLLAQRVDEAAMLLRGSNLSLDDIARACGFVDRRHLARVFTRSVGVAPTKGRQAARH